MYMCVCMYMCVHCMCACEKRGMENVREGKERGRERREGGKGEWEGKERGRERRVGGKGEREGKERGRERREGRKGEREGNEEWKKPQSLKSLLTPPFHTQPALTWVISHDMGTASHDMGTASHDMGKTSHDMGCWAQPAMMMCV